jgi:MoaA/NifB/PqqE/SkfB family radical SAM enzyme
VTDFDAYPRGEPEPSTVRLRNVFLHVTKACNLQCTYCYFSARTALPDELSTGEWRRQWSDLVRLQPDKVIFTGGEPLLRRDLLELLRSFKEADEDHRVLRCLNSNGHLIDPAMAESLVGLVDEMRISLDGFPGANDRARGAGNHAAAWTALDHLHDVGFEPKLLVTVTRESLPDLEEFLVRCLEKGYSRINLNLFRPVGRGADHPEWAVAAPDVRAKARSAWKRVHPEINLPLEPERTDQLMHCGAGRFINVMPNGDVYPCHVLSSPEFRLGSLRRDGLLAICSRAGLLGRLASLDFAELGRRDSEVGGLLQKHPCLGVAYDGTKHKGIWKSGIL